MRGVTTARLPPCACPARCHRPTLLPLPSLRLTAPTQHKKHKHSSKDKDKDKERERERLLKEAKKFLKQREAPAVSFSCGPQTTPRAATCSSSHQCRIAELLDRGVAANLAVGSRGAACCRLLVVLSC